MQEFQSQLQPNQNWRETLPPRFYVQESSTKTADLKKILNERRIRGHKTLFFGNLAAFARHENKEIRFSGLLGHAERRVLETVKPNEKQSNREEDYVIACEYKPCETCKAWMKEQAQIKGLRIRQEWIFDKDKGTPGNTLLSPYRKMLPNEKFEIPSDYWSELSTDPKRTETTLSQIEPKYLNKIGKKAREKKMKGFMESKIRKNKKKILNYTEDNFNEDYPKNAFRFNTVKRIHKTSQENSKKRLKSTAYLKSKNSSFFDESDFADIEDNLSESDFI